MKQIAILVFDDVDELDFVGPLEVFGVTGRLYPDTVRAVTCSVSGVPVKGRYGLRMDADYSIDAVPKFDILLVPGGYGALREMKSPATIEFVRRAARECELVASVCTGALVLAAAGILDQKKATTHWAHLEALNEFPGIAVQEGVRYVHDGRVITSAGISAGIDMALYLVGLFFGSNVKKEVAHRMEYEERLQKPEK